MEFPANDALDVVVSAANAVAKGGSVKYDAAGDELGEHVMKVCNVILLLCLAVPAVVFYGEGATAKAAETPMFDVAKPDAWEAAINRPRKDLSKIAEAFISVGNDQERPPDVRRKAVLLLGKIRDKRSLDFLISNVSMHIPKMKLLGAEALLETPCMYALYTGDWNTAKAVLDSLEKPKSKEDLLRLSAVLESTLTRDHAQAIVDVELAKLISVVNTRKENLKIIKDYMK